MTSNNVSEEESTDNGNDGGLISLVFPFFIMIISLLILLKQLQIFS